jgi:hypothetical protein
MLTLRVLRRCGVSGKLRETLVRLDRSGGRPVVT